MQILLTGATGMVGKNIIEHRLASDFQIYAPSSKELNLLAPSDIKNFLNNNKVDMIIHCAGKVGGIQANISNQVGFLNDNLLMGINLINIAYESGVRQLINLGSSCMYPKDYKNPLKEEYILNAPLEPTNEGYALAKITVAKLCEYMSKQYKVSYKTLIPCNLYGRWDKFDDKSSHMVPAVIKKIYLAKTKGDKCVTIWGDGNSRREFMFASDFANSIFFAINNFDKLDHYTNVGIGTDYSINEYYKIIAKAIGYTGEFAHDLTKPSGMQQKLVDVTKLNSLGWYATYSLEQGIQKTLNFYIERIVKSNLTN